MEFQQHGPGRWVSDDERYVRDSVTCRNLALLDVMHSPLHIFRLLMNSVAPYIAYCESPSFSVTYVPLDGRCLSVYRRGSRTIPSR